MTSFAAAVAQVNSTDTQAVTANGMPTNSTSGSALVDFFFVAGSSRGKDISAKFLAAVKEDALLALKILFWTRDVRGGAGERLTFRKLMVALEANHPELAARVLPLVAEYGRWDDLHVFNTPALQSLAVKIHADAIRAGKNAQDLLTRLPHMSEEEAAELVACYNENHAI